MKKLLALLLALTMLLSMSACGASEPAVTEIPTEEEVIPTVYLPYEGETLRVLCQSGAHAESARSMIPEFEETVRRRIIKFRSVLWIILILLKKRQSRKMFAVLI